MTPTFRLPSLELLLLSAATGTMAAVRNALNGHQPEIALTILTRLGCLKPHLTAEDSTCPDVVILDLPLPETLEAVRMLKERNALHDIPVIAIVGDRQEDDCRPLYDARVNCCIGRPVTQESLDEMARVLVEYWFDVVRLPPPGRAGTLDW